MGFQDTKVSLTEVLLLQFWIFRDSQSPDFPQKSSKPVGRRSQFCISNKLTGVDMLSTNDNSSSNGLNQDQNIEKFLG